METYRVIQLYFSFSSCTVAAGLTREAAIQHVREAMRDRSTKEIDDGVCYLVEREDAEQDDEEIVKLLTAAARAQQVGVQWSAFEAVKMVGDIAFVLRIER